MIGAFEHRNGAFRSRVGRRELELISRLIAEVLVVLDEPGDVASFVHAATGIEKKRGAPADPALSSLLPPMSSDAAEADQLRALTEDALRADKSSRLRLVAQTIKHLNDSGFADFVEVAILKEEGWDWLRALNDLRLALAGELGIRTSWDAEQVTGIALEQPMDKPLRDVAQMERQKSWKHRREACAMYVAVTWWQDSLLGTLSSDPENG